MSINLQREKKGFFNEGNPKFLRLPFSKSDAKVAFDVYLKEKNSLTNREIEVLENDKFFQYWKNLYDQKNSIQEKDGKIEIIWTSVWCPKELKKEVPVESLWEEKYKRFLINKEQLTKELQIEMLANKVVGIETFPHAKEEKERQELEWKLLCEERKKREEEEAIARAELKKHRQLLFEKIKTREDFMTASLVKAVEILATIIDRGDRCGFEIFGKSIVYSCMEELQELFSKDTKIIELNCDFGGCTFSVDIEFSRDTEKVILFISGETYEDVTSSRIEIVK